MEFGTTIVGIFILLVCILPFFMVNVNSKRRKKKQLQELIEYAQENNAQINSHEIWVNSSIGIDEVHNALFYITQVSDQKVFQKLNLSIIDSCKIVNVSNTFNGKSSKYKVIEKLDLLFEYKDKKMGNVEFNIYNASHQNLTITGELAIAEKWNKIINDKLFSLAQT